MTRADLAREAIFAAEVLVDYRQTLDIKNHPGVYELNPIMGRHPSDDRIAIGCAATVALQMDSLVKTDDPSHNEIVKRIMNSILSSRHHGVDDFEMFDFSRIMDKWDSLFFVMRIIVGFNAGIALLVGGVGVMNMMLVSVSERVREIGIRKALGAAPRDILWQFLFESIVLSGSGGLVGVVAGVFSAAGASALIRHFKPMWLSVVSPGAVIAATTVSLGIGVLFGFVPALRAARLSAIEAIRR